MVFDKNDNYSICHFNFHFGKRENKHGQVEVNVLFVDSMHTNNPTPFFCIDIF